MDEVLGVDVGGTFTDFFAFGPEGLRAWKRLSTPHAPEEAVLAGIDDATRFARIVHGSTVATNALLERRGPRTVLVTTAGFRDLLEIRRQERPRLYDLEPARRPHVVTRGDVIEVQERLDAEGKAVIQLTEAEISRVVEVAHSFEPAVFAVCFLFSFLDSGPERAIVEALRAAGLEACASFEVLPEFREYERASTTAVNAFLRPTVGRYLSSLGARLPKLRVMHSAGGAFSPAGAAALPVSMVMSGPAGGVLGALAVATTAGYDDVVTFDMGGTSTDVSLCSGGRPSIRNSAEVDGLALNTPMVDIVTVGAGGGSIARLDAGGALVVGPESTGADPGPACYGRGTLPTVSDANLILGRLRSEQPLAGTLHLNAARARTALATLGDPDEFARAVVEVVNANMARAVRAVSLERGFDPAGFTLVAFGGAGPLHACELADEVGLRRVLVPRYPGVLSAFGMSNARGVVERSTGRVVPLAAAGEDVLSELEYALAGEISDAMRDAGVGAGSLEWFGDARYRGQGHELRIVLGSDRTPAAIATAFHSEHLRRFGYNSPGRLVELVALRARLTENPWGMPENLDTAEVAMPAPLPTAAAGPSLHVARRDALGQGATLNGPCVVIQDDATTSIPPGWRGTVDAHLNLLMERKK